MVSTSRDGVNWRQPVLAAANNARRYDKEWIACDSSATSPHFGNCYIEVDLTSSGNRVVMTTSKDGGRTWGPETTPAGSPSGLGGQPLVQPDGTVVVPYSGNFSSIKAFRSTDGGSSWTAPVTVATVSDHYVPGRCRRSPSAIRPTARSRTRRSTRRVRCRSAAASG